MSALVESGLVPTIRTNLCTLYRLWLQLANHSHYMSYPYDRIHRLTNPFKDDSQPNMMSILHLDWCLENLLEFFHSDTSACVHTCTIIHFPVTGHIIAPVTRKEYSTMLVYHNTTVITFRAMSSRVNLNDSTNLHLISVSTACLP